MLSTASGEEEESLNNSNTTKIHNRALLSSPSNSKSSSSLASASPSSSPSPFSPFTLHTHPSPRTTTMEEVWKDISLAALHDRPSIADSTATNTTFRGGLTFQDFLSRPLGKNPPPTSSGGGEYGSPASPPAIGLSLNSVPNQFNLLGNTDDHPFGTNSLLQDQPISNVSSLNVSFDGLASPSSSLLALGKKRFSESDCNSGDRRHKRMIKNRESAARSRARKQAYTTELELEVAHLMEENARLKRQQQQLCLAAASSQVPKKNILHRTSTAPF